MCLFDVIERWSWITEPLLTTCNPPWADLHFTSTFLVVVTSHACSTFESFVFSWSRGHRPTQTWDAQQYACDWNTEQAFLSCDVITKVLVKWRLHQSKVIAHNLRYSMAHLHIHYLCFRALHNCNKNILHITECIVAEQKLSTYLWTEIIFFTTFVLAFLVSYIKHLVTRLRNIISAKVKE